MDWYGYTVYTQFDMKVMVDGEKGDGMHGMHLSEYNLWWIQMGCGRKL